MQEKPNKSNISLFLAMAQLDPKGSPERKETQVRMSKEDAYQLGVCRRNRKRKKKIANKSKKQNRK